MINFISRNLDSIIISTIFLLLGFLPSILNFSKDKRQQDVLVKNTNIEDSNVKNTYNQNYIKNTYNTTQSTINVNNTQISNDDSSDQFLIYLFIYIPLLVLFYKNINKILSYSIAITISCLILFILIYQKFIRISNSTEIFKLPSKISIRNIVSCIAILINFFIIIYKISFSPSIKSFLKIIGKSSNSIDTEMILEIKDFLFSDFYGSSLIASIVINVIFSIFLILQLLLSYIWLLSFIKCSNKNNISLSKFWSKIYDTLYKKQSRSNEKFWITSMIILYFLSTGLLPFIFYKIVSISLK